MCVCLQCVSTGTDCYFSLSYRQLSYQWTEQGLKDEKYKDFKLKMYGHEGVQ